MKARVFAHSVVTVFNILLLLLSWMWNFRPKMVWINSELEVIGLQPFLNGKCGFKHFLALNMQGLKRLIKYLWAKTQGAKKSKGMKEQPKFMRSHQRPLVSRSEQRGFLSTLTLILYAFSQSLYCLYMCFLEKRLKRLIVFYQVKCYWTEAKVHIKDTNQKKRWAC